MSESFSVRLSLRSGWIAIRSDSADTGDRKDRYSNISRTLGVDSRRICGADRTALDNNSTIKNIWMFIYNLLHVSPISKHGWR
jgi:hypothetical protein